MYVCINQDESITKPTQTIHIYLMSGWSGGVPELRGKTCQIFVVKWVRSYACWKVCVFGGVLRGMKEQSHRGPWMWGAEEELHRTYVLYEWSSGNDTDQLQFSEGFLWQSPTAITNTQMCPFSSCKWGVGSGLTLAHPVLWYLWSAHGKVTFLCRCSFIHVIVVLGAGVENI